VPQACLATTMCPPQKGYGFCETSRGMLSVVAWSSYAAHHCKDHVYLLVAMLGYESGLGHLAQPRIVGC